MIRLDGVRERRPLVRVIFEKVKKLYNCHNLTNTNDFQSTTGLVLLPGWQQDIMGKCTHLAYAIKGIYYNIQFFLVFLPRKSDTLRRRR